MHPHAAARKPGRVKHILSQYARGGVPHTDEKSDRKLIKEMIVEHEREGHAPGVGPKERLDKRARGGRIRHHTTVNVVVPNRSEVPGPVPAVGPPISRVLPTGGPALPSVPTPGPTGRPVPAPTFARGGRVKVETGTPLEGGAKGPDDKPPSYDKSISKAKQKSPREPSGMKRGGRIPHIGESLSRTHAAFRSAHNKKGFASGGRTHAYPKFEAGSLSGEGRLEKIEKYGHKAK